MKSTCVDTLIVSVPKAGTHLLLELCRAILKEHFGFGFDQSVHKMHVQSKRSIESFLQSHPLCKKILLVRNIKDLVVSRKDYSLIESVQNNLPAYLKEHGMLKWQALTEQEKISHVLRWFREFKQTDHRRHRLEWYIEDSISFGKENPDALVVRFESLFTQLNEIRVDAIKNIAEYINAPIPEVKLEAIAHCVYGKSATFVEGRKLYRYVEQFDDSNLKDFYNIVGGLEGEYNKFFGYTAEGHFLEGG